MSNEEIMNVVKPAICRQLKSPASAQFPVDLISIVGDDTRGYRVEGFVDSQNSYGAMIRNDFTADVKIENGDGVVLALGKEFFYEVYSEVRKDLTEEQLCYPEYKKL